MHSGNSFKNPQDEQDEPSEQRQLAPSLAAALDEAANAPAEQSADLWANVGVLARRENNLHLSEAAFRQALALRPGWIHVELALAHTLEQEGKHDEAESIIRRHIHCPVLAALANSMLGSLLRRTGRLRQSLEAYERAVRLKPNPQDELNCGVVLFELGELSLARRFVSGVLTKPEPAPGAWNLLGMILLECGLAPEADHAFREAIASARRNRQPAFPFVSNLLLCQQYHHERTSQETFELHRQGGELIAADCVNPPAAPRVISPEARRLRVGYLSPDFRTHSVAFFVESVLELHDRSRFEVFCYSISPVRDTTTERLIAASDHWRECWLLPPDRLHQTIRNDRIDILVDLTGHMANNRLQVFAGRAAPCQITWLGYPDTTGVPNVDARIVDWITDPPGAEMFHTEQLIRLPRVFLAWRPPPLCPEPRHRATGRPLTFGCFGTLSKVNPLVLQSWAEILKHLPDSHLLLKARQLGDAGIANAVAAQLRKSGVDPARIRMLGQTKSIRDHLDLYGDVDIALDTFPYNGTTTTCEALWMGAPVVTLAGDRHVGRVGLSILDSLGLSKELAAHDVRDYVRKAVTMASDTSRLRQVARTLRTRMETSPLRNERELTRILEENYEKLFRRLMEDNSP